MYQNERVQIYCLTCRVVLFDVLCVDANMVAPQVDKIIETHLHPRVDVVRTIVYSYGA